MVAILGGAWSAKVGELRSLVDGPESEGRLDVRSLRLILPRCESCRRGFDRSRFCERARSMLRAKAVLDANRREGPIERPETGGGSKDVSRRIVFSGTKGVPLAVSARILLAEFVLISSKMRRNGLKTLRQQKWLCAISDNFSRNAGIVVDSLAGCRLYTPHQRGRGAAGGQEVRPC